jgi:hypothetical protein
LKKYNCPQTRLEALSYSVCLPFSTKKEVRPSTIAILQKKLKEKENICIEDNPVIGKCIDVYQEIDISSPLKPQLDAGFNFLERVKNELKQPPGSISMFPIHDNPGIFVWDFREHEELLAEWRKLAEKTGGKAMEAHDYAEIIYKLP